MAPPGRNMKVGKPKDFKNTLKRVLSYLFVYKKLLFIVLTLILFTTGVSVLSTSLLKVIVDKYLTPLSIEYDVISNVITLYN